MLCSPRTSAAIAALAFLAAPSAAHAQVFTDSEFAAGTYSTASNNSANSQINFGVDYSSFGVFNNGLVDITISLPEAPSTTGSATATTGVFMSVNNDIFNPSVGAATFAAIMPNGVNVGNGTATPNYRMRVDVFHSTGAGFVGDGSDLDGTTNLALVGLNQADTTNVKVRELTAGTPLSEDQGAALGTTADAGAFDDYYALYGGSAYLDRVGGTTLNVEYRTAADGTQDANTGLTTRKLRDFWLDNGFEPEGDAVLDDDPANADPNDLLVSMSDTNFFTPNPADPSLYDRTENGLVDGNQVRFFADSFPTTTDPIHYVCDPVDCQDEGNLPPADTDGSIPAGVTGNAWATHELYWVNDEFTYVINGVPVLQKEVNSGTVFETFSNSGTALLGFWDRFSSIATSPVGANFVVYDNLLIEAATPADVPDVEAYLITNGFLPSATALEGDYNSDGVVDAADYTVYRDTLGSSSDLRADGNGNGVIDPTDYTVWADAFGNAASSSVAVPEPGAIALLSGAIGLLTLRRR